MNTSDKKQEIIRLISMKKVSEASAFFNKKIKGSVKKFRPLFEIAHAARKYGNVAVLNSCWESMNLAQLENSNDRDEVALYLGNNPDALNLLTALLDRQRDLAAITLLRILGRCVVGSHARDLLEGLSPEVKASLAADKLDLMFCLASKPNCWEALAAYCEIVKESPKLLDKLFSCRQSYPAEAIAEALKLKPELADSFYQASLRNKEFNHLETVAAYLGKKTKVDVKLADNEEALYTLLVAAYRNPDKLELDGEVPEEKLGRSLLWQMVSGRPYHCALQAVPELVPLYFPVDKLVALLDAETTEHIAITVFDKCLNCDSVDAIQLMRETMRRLSVPRRLAIIKALLKVPFCDPLSQAKHCVEDLEANVVECEALLDCARELSQKAHRKNLAVMRGGHIGLGGHMPYAGIMGLGALENMCDIQGCGFGFPFLHETEPAAEKPCEVESYVRFAIAHLKAGGSSADLAAKCATLREAHGVVAPEKAPSSVEVAGNAVAAGSSLLAEKDGKAYIILKNGNIAVVDLETASVCEMAPIRQAQQ